MMQSAADTQSAALLLFHAKLFYRMQADFSPVCHDRTKGCHGKQRQYQSTAPTHPPVHGMPGISGTTGCKGCLSLPPLLYVLRKNMRPSSVVIQPFRTR
jgi:hypothetical protein